LVGAWWSCYGHEAGRLEQSRVTGHAVAVHRAAAESDEQSFPGLVQIMFAPVLAFVVAGVTTTLLWDDPVSVPLVVWQAFIGWPIGGHPPLGRTPDTG